MKKGTIFVAMTGHRKATQVYCEECAVWHPTERGVGAPGCPLQRSEAAVARREPASEPVYAVAFVPRERLGSRKRMASTVRVEFRGVA